jgi:hypothetical protein
VDDVLGNDLVASPSLSKLAELQRIKNELNELHTKAEVATVWVRAMRLLLCSVDARAIDTHQLRGE